MEFDPGWLLIGLPLAFVLGWLASRFDQRQVRADSRRAPKAYFKGLNYLLNEQQDQAIDAFIEAVQNDPETTELHFALGNLFRRRGEYNRAVRVHEHLLSRDDLSRPDRERAQHGLAQDYLKAGLLDRAEDALRRLEGTPYETQARLALLMIYERSHDWKQAGAIAQRMQEAHQGDFSTRLAHYLCEQALVRAARGDVETARNLLAEAIATAPAAARARLELARLQMQQGEHATALHTLMEAAQATPAALPLAAGLMVEAANACHERTSARTLLETHFRQQPSLDVLDAIVALQTPESTAQDDTGAQGWYADYLNQEPSLVVAAKWLSHETLSHEDRHPAIQRALDLAARPLTRYRCAACGFEALQHFWQCPGCQSWDSYPPRRVEEL